MEPMYQQEESKLRATRNDISGESRAVLVDIVNMRLAGAIDLRLQAKQAHWNVRGPRFIALHELFDQVASAGGSFQDLLGERVAQLGGYAAGTVEAVRAGSPLASYPIEMSDEEDHARWVTDALARFAAAARSGIGESEDLGDDVTADILTQITREADKLVWFLESHLREHDLGEPRGIHEEPPSPGAAEPPQPRH